MAVLHPWQKDILDFIRKGDLYVRSFKSYRDYLKMEKEALKITADTVDYLLENSCVERMGEETYFRTTDFCIYSGDAVLKILLLLYQCHAHQEKIRGFDWAGIRRACAWDPLVASLSVAAMDADTEYWDACKYLDTEADDEERLSWLIDSNVPLGVRKQAAWCIKNPDILLRTLKMADDEGKPLRSFIGLVGMFKRFDKKVQDEVIARSDDPEEFNRIVNPPRASDDPEIERKWREYRKMYPR
ncbi:MAG: hypothetical protein LBV33_03635 [Lachnospiraceae bacterium]|jgi:hypothetical protein|nr:hypothetical protein [Lachnospiraceae bacterium]